MKNKRFSMLGIVMLLALASLVVGLTGCSGVAAADMQPVSVNVNNQQGIWVNGQGKVTVTPDIAYISMGVSAQAATVTEAQAQAAAAMDKVIAALKSNGVAEKDIQTQYYNIQQLTRYDNVTQQSVVTGYMVSNSVNVKIRDVGKAGVIIDAVAAAGGDYTRINGVNFSIDKPEQYYAQAREQAMADAKTKANQLAQLAGVTLGRATYITESTSSPYVPYPYPIKAADAVQSSTTYITPGEMDVTVSVQVAYAIQ